MLGHSVARGEEFFKMLNYEDIPVHIREMADAEVAGRMSGSVSKAPDYTGFTAEFVQNFDVGKDTHTTQGQIYRADRDAYLWNLTYYGAGTAEFIGSVLMYFDGNILLSYTGSREGFTRILEKSAGKSFYDWTLEEQYAFSELFIRNSSSASDNRLHYGLPKNDDLPLEVLVEIGKEYLSSHYQLPKEKIESYKVQDAYLMNVRYSNDPGAEEGTRILRFVNPNHPESYEYQVTLSAANGTVYFSTPFPTTP